MHNEIKKFINDKNFPRALALSESLKKDDLNVVMVKNLLNTLIKLNNGLRNELEELREFLYNNDFNQTKRDADNWYVETQTIMKFFFGSNFNEAIKIMNEKKNFLESKDSKLLSISNIEVTIQKMISYKKCLNLLMEEINKSHDNSDEINADNINTESYEGILEAIKANTDNRYFDGVFQLCARIKNGDYK